MNAHQLDANGVILNTIVVDSLVALPSLVNAAIGGSIGDSIIGGVLMPRPTPVPTVPQSVPRLNARLILLGRTLPSGVSYWADIVAFVAAIPGVDGDQARAYFEDAQTWRPDNALVAKWATARSISSAEIGGLFIAAGALNA